MQNQPEEESLEERLETKEKSFEEDFEEKFRRNFEEKFKRNFEDAFKKNFEETMTYKRAKIVADLYFQLTENDAEEILQKLVELEVIDDLRKSEFVATFIRAKRIKDPMYAAKRKMEITGKIKEAVSFYIGKIISGIDAESYPSAKIAVYAAFGKQFLEDYNATRRRIT